jgi:Subtilisin-like serine proteases
MAESDRGGQEKDEIKRFDPRILDRSVIAIPLLEEISKDENAVHAVIIDVNLDYDEGREAARKWIREAIKNAIDVIAPADEKQGVREKKTDISNQYIFARLNGKVIREVVRLDVERAGEEAKTAEKPRLPKKRGKSSVQSATAALYRFRGIYRIWPDFKISPCITKSLATVKADAAQTSFCAHGTDITWAVMDSGIDANHPHFALHRNVDPSSALHADFTDTPNVPKDGNAALIDRFGHGTHVAGIVAGQQVTDGTKAQAQKMRAVTRSVRGYEEGDSPAVETHEVVLDSIRGMAPRCHLVSLKVLDDEGNGEVSNLIAAIAHIQEKNGHGRLNLIHGVNISLGYDFDPEWFACGQSPLCVEINRLVRSGVVVVVAAGNTGYGALAAQQRTTNAGMQVTINDPGNAELAITVGSTHREMPHVYGVSYFSSKGPTGDGRLKPDVVAPGEKILSAATGKLLMDRAEGKQCEYVEDSGTSMAAPHVSGVIAAFLSVRREFIGEPERVKQIFLGAATDLKRERSFQGAGLIDLMRAIQSV